MKAFKRKWLLTVLALQVAAMFLLPGMVCAGMWVGVQAGLNYTPNTNLQERIDGHFERTYENVKFDNNFLGGLTLGYDFNDSGLGGRTWPAWMKYFSLALDSTYENMSFKHQGVKIEVKGNFDVAARHTTGITPSGTIRLIYLTPMIIGKVGFIPNAEMPFGRLQPYVGAGAGIVFSNPEVSGLETEERNKVDMSVLLESGLRYMLFRNVSLDAALRFRVIPTQFGNSYNAYGDTAKVNLDLSPVFFNALLRVSYHF